MNRILLLGTGLIGGSIILNLKSKGLSPTVFGIDQSDMHLEKAKERGIIDEVSSLESLPKDLDLIILAIPVDASVKLLPTLLDQIDSNTVVMDVGSTKSELTQSVKGHPKRGRFVAFHPMWGTENSGPGSALKESFSSRAAVICDSKDSDPDALALVENLGKTLEMHLLEMSAEDHDIHTAYISHISHITSYALANTVLEKEREEETIFQLASSGFSSTVRLAKSHPEMWVPIFRQNKENVLDVLNEHISQLRKFKSALEKENYTLLEELIRNANKIRPILDERSKD